MQGKKGCISLEQTTIHLKWATHTGARLGSTTLVKPVPNESLALLGWGFCVLGLRCVSQRNFRVIDNWF